MATKGFYIIKAPAKSVVKNRDKISSLSLYEKHFKSGDIAYETLRHEWQNIDEKIQLLNHSTYNDDVIAYIKNCYNTLRVDRKENIIPSATILTGVNQPDHSEQFFILRDRLRSEVTPHVAIVYSANATSHKAIVEHVVHEFINAHVSDNSEYESDIDMEQSSRPVKLKKNRCTMSVLRYWYSNQYAKSNITVHQSPSKKHKPTEKGNQLVIILPDFEGYNPDVLQDFILSLSSLTNVLPIVLVFGVATSAAALHKTFPYKVSSKLLIQVFSSQSSTTRINEVLEKVFLTHECPFHLSGKAFQLLTDIFLFYDFSVTALVQGFKACMMEHYYGRSFTSLCCPREHLNSSVSHLKDDDLEDIRHLPSFRGYVEIDTCENRIALLTDNNFLRKRLISALEEVHTYLYSFHLILRVLLIFVHDLPKQPLGKQFRELYLTSTSTPITKSEEYGECLKMLQFQSKIELCQKLAKACQYLDKELSNKDGLKKQSSPGKKRACQYLDNEFTKYSAAENSSRVSGSRGSPGKRSSPRKRLSLDASYRATNAINSTVHILKSFSVRLENSSLEAGVSESDENMENEPCVLNRQNLKEKLLDAVKKDRKTASEFECLKSDLIKYLNDYIFEPFLKMPSSLPFYEIFFFTDISKIKRHIIGTPWAAIHSALNNPVAYLQCECCELPRPDSIIPSLPDISIVYKLHLECGKLINLYDWLQAFVCILEPDVEEDDDIGERRFIKPEHHARFTKAVLELQLLGFIKPSKRKTDHVMRLTW